MEEKKCLYCEGPMLLPRSDAIFCSQRCGVYYRRQRKLPVELTSRARWVRRNHAKMPMTVNARVASVTDPGTWSSYSEAKRSHVGAGMGFVLNGDGIGCLDLDHCIVGGRLESWAQEIVDANAGTFMEISASGSGIHVWGFLDSAPGRRIRDGRNLEIYSTGRYIALGEPMPGTSLSMNPLVIP